MLHGVYYTQYVSITAVLFHCSYAAKIRCLDKLI